MAYVAKDDFSLRIQRDHLDDLLTQAAEDTGLSTSDVLDQHIQTGEDEITAYLSHRYDIAAELVKTGDLRSNILVLCCLDCALYHLFQSITPKDIPMNRETLYMDSRDRLDRMREGEIYPPGVDLLPDADIKGKPSLFSNTAFVYHPHDAMSVSQFNTEPIDPTP